MSSFRPRLFHMLERVPGKHALAVVERDFGYEGELAAVLNHPPGTWLCNTEVTLLRSTVANPIPQLVSKEWNHKLLLPPNCALRIEAASESGKTSERR